MHAVSTAGCPGCRHTTLLHWAVYWERAPLVAALVQAGADPTVKDGWGGDCARVCAAIKDDKLRGTIEGLIGPLGGGGVKLVS